MVRIEDDERSLDSNGDECVTGLLSTSTKQSSYRRQGQQGRRSPPRHSPYPRSPPLTTQGRFSIDRIRSRPEQARVSERGSKNIVTTALSTALRAPLKLIRSRSPHDGENSPPQNRVSGDHPRRKSPPREQSLKLPTRATGNAPGQGTDEFEMVKRRVRVNLAIFERPLMTDTQVVVDARYRGIKLIGSGSYSIVLSATDGKTGSRVAIKKIFSAFDSSRMARSVLREVRLLRHLRHPNIVQMLDIDVPRQFKEWDEVYIVTPLLKTSLRQALLEGLVKTQLQRKRIAYGLLNGLAYMQSLGLIHRDVKSGNVLLDKHFNAKICDLGSARFYSGAASEPLKTGPHDDIHDHHDQESADEPALSTQLTTLVQSAPEFCLGAEYGAGVDVWAAGCVIAEMQHPHHKFLFDVDAKHALAQDIVDVVGFPDDVSEVERMLPRPGQRQLRRLKKTRLNGRTRIAERLGTGAEPVVVDLLENMLRFSPHRRFSARQALLHPWFDEVRDDHRLPRTNYDFRLTEPHGNASKSEMKRSLYDEVVAMHAKASLRTGASQAPTVSGRMSIS